MNKDVIGNHVMDSLLEYDVTIGIEVHVQLTTKSKVFCSCPNHVGEQPNSLVCPVCMGHPGTLPALNEEVVNNAIALGCALGCTINQKTSFARKHYFYPDLPKGYQITQAEDPICTGGGVMITHQDGSTKIINLIRIHMEEDAGKNTHAGNESFIDLNRAGTPLLEIVSAPDISSAFEARAYLKALRATVMYLGICSGNMEDGAFRADTNISLKPRLATILGTRCELKNINSFKFIGDAIEYEIKRQQEILKTGNKVIQQTLLWDTKEHKTYPMRSKGEAADYRYMPEPDLPYFIIDTAHIKNIKDRLPELPDAIMKRLQQQDGLTFDDAEILVNNQDLLQYYQEVKKLTASTSVITWVLRDLMSMLYERKFSVAQSPITPERLAELIDLVDRRIITMRSASQVFKEMIDSQDRALQLVEKHGLQQVADHDALEKIVQEIIANNPKQVQQYCAGQEKLYGFFVGQVMAVTKGTADPKIINELLGKALKS
jgi:aspartyl-tRNA(Asn)/glutamyl-tRNA(Gln) amidotransferase subunit B